MRLVNWLVTEVCGVPGSAGPAVRNEYVLRCAEGSVPADVPPVVAAILARHAPAAARMNAFYWKLFDRDLQAEYPGPPFGAVQNSSGRDEAPRFRPPR